MNTFPDPRLDECRSLLAKAQYQEAALLADQLVATIDNTQLMETLGLQAQARRGQGRYEDAIQSLHQRSKVAREQNDQDAQAWALIGVGQLYMLLNRYELALQALTEAVRLASAPLVESALLSALADVYAQTGAFDQAEWLCGRAIMALKVLDNEGFSPLADVYRIKAERQLAMARLAEAQGQYQRTLYVTEGIEIDARMGTGTLTKETELHATFGTEGDQVALVRQHAAALAPLVDLLAGRALMNLGDLQAAQDRLSKACDLARKHGDIAIKVEATAGLGRVALLGGRIADAIRQFATAVDEAERWLTYFEVEEFRAGLRTRLTDTYADLIITAARSGRTELAWRTIERARAREFLASLRSADNALHLIGPEVRLLEKFTNQIGAISNRLLEVEPNTTLYGQLREVRSRFLDEKARYLQELRRYPRRLAFMDNTVASSEQVLNVLGTDTAFVEYFLTPNQVLVTVITDGSFQVIELEIHPDALTSQVQLFMNTIGKPPIRESDETWRTLAGSLYKALWAPLIPHVRHKPRVCIVPHGAMFELPFAVLGTDEPLLTQTEIVYAPSASILTVVGSKPLRHLKRVGVFANPLPNGSWDLPATEQEANAISQTSFEAAFWHGPDATPKTVMEAASTVDILHLACHAEFDAQRPLLSALLLAPEEGESGRLETYSIYGAEVKAQLVVLSACETGRFAHGPADELQGFVRAFMSAGACTVIGSQWIVDDPATASLMTSFYEMLAAGESPGAAVRSAQLNLYSLPSYTHPYYWAAFALYGGWR